MASKKEKASHLSQSDYFGHDRVTEMMVSGGEALAEVKEAEQRDQKLRELLMGLEKEEDYLGVSNKDFKLSPRK